MPSSLLAWIEENSPERGTLIVLSLASICLYYATSTALAWYRLRQFPGPPIAAISNIWGFITVAFGNSHNVIESAQEKYGRIMRIGPNSLMVSDPETIWRISSARSSYDRAGWYGSVKFHPEGDSVFSELSTARHDKRKAKLIPGFSGRGALNHEADLDSQIVAFVNYIKDKVRNGKADKIDFSKIARWFQLDLITLIGLGKAWGDLVDETDHFDFLESMDAATVVTHSVAMVPLLRKIFSSKLFMYLTAPRVTDKRGLGSSLG